MDYSWGREKDNRPFIKIKTVSKYLSIRLISFTVIENSSQETVIIAKGILSYRYEK
jgi:hypothetical protein